jgi:8-oxo-dGTP pyrophosphatase MutT (NUDIX family)
VNDQRPPQPDPDTPDRPEPWPRLASEDGPALPVARVRYDTMRNPRNDRELVRTVLQTPEWVNVVAFDEQDRLVCVRQFRFGTGKVSLEIPGGLVDPGEAHGDAARRELREETGHTAERWTYIGWVEPNPAFLDNVCHHWLAEGARATHPLDQDLGEDIVVEALERPAILEAIRSGEMRHGLVLNALSRVMDLSVLPRPEERPEERPGERT